MPERSLPTQACLYSLYLPCPIRLFARTLVASVQAKHLVSTEDFDEGVPRIGALLERLRCR
jgi:hypothetical protein